MCVAESSLNNRPPSRIYAYEPYMSNSLNSFKGRGLQRIIKGTTIAVTKGYTRSLDSKP